VYRSVNGRITWTQINTGLGGTTVYGLTINPEAPSELFVSSFKNGVFKTTNYGNNWSQAGLALNKTWITTQAPSNVQTTYTGTFGDGVYRSPDGGGTWVHTEAGIRNAWITGVVSVPGSAGQVFVSLNGGGVKHSADGGQTWEEFNEGLLDRYINGLAIDPAGTTLFALTDTHGLVRRTLSGGSWAGSTPALPKTIQEEPLYPEGHPLAGADTAEGLPGSPADGLAPGGGAPATVPLIDMEISTSNPNIMYLGTQYSSGCSICGVYQSTDGGSNWNYKGLAGQTIYSLAINPANPLEVYAATSAAGSVKTSTNGGNNWSDMSLAGRSFYALAVSPASPGMLFAATDSGVYLWNGLAWSSIGLSGVAVSSLAAHPHIPGNLSAGTASGAYNSVNGGASWQAGPAALEGLVIQSMHFEPAAGVVFYGTTTRGMYRGMIPN